MRTKWALFALAALCSKLACAQAPPLDVGVNASFSRPADKAAPRTDGNSQIAHEQLLEKARKGGIDIYFLGDSITRRWGATDYPEFLANWNTNFFGWNAANFGWGADRIENILWRLANGELDGVNPKIIVLLAGINNVGTVPGGDSKVENITRGLQAVVSVCQEKAPSAVIVLTALFPRNDNMAVIPTINRINDRLAMIADGKKVRYLNMNGQLADPDGMLFEGISKDKLHPTLKGYQIWADSLKPIFTEVIGPPAKTDHAPAPTGDPSARTSKRNGAAGQPETPRKPPPELVDFFAPPEMYRSDFGSYRSPLLFADGSEVRSAADWARRRQELLSTWQTMLGPWPPLIQNPKVEVVNTARRENITQQQLRIEIALGNEMVDALLLVPDLQPSKKKRPAVLVVYYDAETGAGLGAPLRDYGWQLARRGFVTLSIGKPNAQIDLNNTNKPKTEPYLGPVGKPVRVQPLSALAYAAANAHTVLARQPDVRADRIGVVGHSFGGKWAMFTSCLFDKFACAVWSDPGIVFDERDRRKENPSGSVNYWDVWYLGSESGIIADPKNAGPFRKLPAEGQARTGAYKSLIEGGHDLVELHALMAPRPFLVSGGTADLPERWPALNHAIAVNNLLGYENRVALTSRVGHSPTEQANEQVYRFFEWCLGGSTIPQAK